MAEASQPRRRLLGAIVLTLIVVAALAVAAVFFLPQDDDADAALDEGQELVEVTRGDLLNQVSSSGSVVFPNRETLTFAAAGTVGAVLVAEGDAVTAGQRLAELDDAAVSRLERDVAQAEHDLEQSREALADLLAPATTLAVEEARAAVAKAELAVQQAEEALDDAETPFSAAEITAASMDADAARESLASAEADFLYITSEHDANVRDATDVLSTAKADYQRVVTNYLGQTLSDDDYRRSPEEFFDTYGIDLHTFFSDAHLEDAVVALLPLVPAPAAGVDDPETPWDEFTVYRWIALYPGSVNGTCEGLNPAQVDVCVLQDFEAAWAPVDRAFDALAAAENSALKATTNAAKAVDMAEDALEQAEERLAEVTVVADDLEVQVKAHEHAVARAKLTDAEERLEELDDPPSPTLITLRQAEVTANAAALSSAREQLAGAVISAPFAGAVSAVSVDAGGSVNANSPIVEIVDPTVAVVDARLDEIDVLSVQEGARAIVTLDGLGGFGLPGVVSTISSAGDNQLGVVTYPVEITLQTPPRLQLREGLSATANIVLQQELDVLLIPNTSIAGTIAEPTVLVSADGEVTERAVTLGASDGFWVVVTEGVQEGESLVSTGGGQGGFNFQTAIRGLGGLGGAGGPPPGFQGGQRRFGGGAGAGAGAGQARPGAGQ